MTDNELIAGLQYLGIDGESFKMVTLLPLVQVAWADGVVQAQERDLIMELAATQFAHDAKSAQLLKSWLSYRPTDAYLMQGQLVLLELARRTDGLQLAPNTLQEIIEVSVDVAQAAGGLFGFGAVDMGEKQVLEQIAQTLTQGSMGDWHSTLDLLGDDEDTFDEPTDVTTIPYDVEVLGDSDVAFRPHSQLAGPSARLVHHDLQGDVSYSFQTEAMSIGRGSQNDVQIRNDAKVSRQHCRIVHLDGSYAIEDLSSANGTFVRDEQVHVRKLFGGEPIVVGSTRFHFESESPD